MTTQKLYRALANATEAYRNRAYGIGTPDNAAMHYECIESLVVEHMPNGSGIDSGTIFDAVKSTGECLVFCVDFRHKDAAGAFDEWTFHEITVHPSLLYGFTVQVSGKNKGNINEYLSDLYRACLDNEISIKL